MEAQQAQQTSLPVDAGSDAPLNGAPDAQHLRFAVEAFEKQFLRDALAQNHGCKVKTADMLGIDGKTLYTKLRKYGMG